jgi:hypothetical protein
MKKHRVFIIALSANLLIGNLLIPQLSNYKNSINLEIAIRIFSSIVASWLLYLLFKIIKNLHNKVSLIIIPILFASLVPLITYIFYSIMMSIDQGGIKAFMGSLLFAIFPVIFSSPLWFPMGLMNSAFCFYYKREIKQSR